MLKESYALSLSPAGEVYSTLDQGYNPFLRSGHLQSTIGVQGMIQDRVHLYCLLRKFIVCNISTKGGYQ